VRSSHSFEHAGSERDRLVANHRSLDVASEQPTIHERQGEVLEQTNPDLLVRPTANTQTAGEQIDEIVGIVGKFIADKITDRQWVSKHPVLGYPK
jgi:hypothetical protein